MQGYNLLQPNSPGYPRGVSVPWTDEPLTTRGVHGTDTPRGYPGGTRAGILDEWALCIYPRCSIGTYSVFLGPTYSARGRISRLLEYCSSTWAVQPEARLQAKIGVSISMGMPMT